MFAKIEITEEMKKDFRKCSEDTCATCSMHLGDDDCLSYYIIDENDGELKELCN